MNDNVLSHFKSVDPLIYKVLVGEKEINLDPGANHFADLCRHIIYQQLASKAADTIYIRYLNLLENAENHPENILLLSIDKLRSAGLSNQKASYIHNIALFFIENKALLENITSLTDSEVIAMLTKIKGVGKWTAEMFLIFTLARNDVFSYGDLGLKKGFEKVYKIEFDIKNKKVFEIIDNWSPYKSYACLALWRAFDSKL